jgi:hypothetical protein
MTVSDCGPWAAIYRAREAGLLVHLIATCRAALQRGARNAPASGVGLPRMHRAQLCTSHPITTSCLLPTAHCIRASRWCAVQQQQRWPAAVASPRVDPRRGSSTAASVAARGLGGQGCESRALLAEAEALKAATDALEAELATVSQVAEVSAERCTDGVAFAAFGRQPAAPACEHQLCFLCDRTPADLSHCRRQPSDTGA